MKRYVLFGMVFFGMSGSALANPPTPREKIENRRDLREDRRETRNDRWDRARLEKLLAEYRVAAKKNQVRKIKALDDRFQAELALELRETRVEVVEKVVEKNDSRQERNEERREVVKDIVKGQPVKAARDATDLRDDRRDLRDDRRDLAVEAASLETKRNLRDRFQPLHGKTDKDSVAQKLGIIEQAVAEAQKEVHTDWKERAEDRKEIIEDRKDGHRPD